MRADHPKIEDYECRDEIWKLFEDCWRTKPQDRPASGEVTQRLKFIINRNTTASNINRLADPQISKHMVRVNAAPFYVCSPEIRFRKNSEEMIRILCRHDCRDITSRINIDMCSSLPLSCGGFGDIYLGYLHDGMKVAIKRPRLSIRDTASGHHALKVYILYPTGSMVFTSHFRLLQKKYMHGRSTTIQTS